MSKGDTMDTKDGTVRYLQEGEKPKKNEVEIRKPNPLCLRCHGKGSYLTDVTRDPNAGNRAMRRNLRKRGIGLKYLPCPDCAEIKKPYEEIV